MEAAVLKPAVGTEMERSSSMTAELEVRKLQELVRELERQNQQLRSRAGGCCPGGPAGPPPSPGYRFPSPLPSLLGPTSSGSLSSAEEPLDCCHPQGAGTASEEEEEEEEDASEPSVLEELELLDLDSLSLKDESDETWLYVTSEAATDSLPPLQWCRQALDSPKFDVGAARRLASHRTEQVCRWRSSPWGPTGGGASRACPVNCRFSAESWSAPPAFERHAPSSPLPVGPVLRSARCPMGKDGSSVAERRPTFLRHAASRSGRSNCPALGSQSFTDGDPGAADDTVDLGYKLQDLTDVQVMAWLQEESLRQDYASTSSTNSQSVSLQLCCIGVGLEEDVVERNCKPTLPCLRQSNDIRERQRSRSRCSRLCSPCTPGFLTAGSAFRGHPSLQQPGPGLGVPACGQRSGKWRRSLPNLCGNSSLFSPCVLPNSLTFDSANSSPRLKNNLPGRGTTQQKTPAAHKDIPV